MYKQMLKVIGVVILSYIVLSLLVIFVITPSTQLKVNGQSVDERIQYDNKLVKYYNLVTEVINMSTKSMAAFNAIDIHDKEETVGFRPLTETTSKAIEKINQVTEYDTETIEVSNGDDSYLKPFVDSHTKLKKKLKELKQNLENINTQIQTLLTERQNGVTSNVPIQSINKLYDSFEDVYDNVSSV